jgi:hypothetical protein
MRSAAAEAGADAKATIRQGETVLMPRPAR